MPSVILQFFSETLEDGEYRTIHFYSEILTVLSNSASDDIKVGLGELKPVQFKAGLQYKLQQGDTFDHIVLYNDSGETTTVEFYLSNNDIIDNRLTISGSVFNDILAQLGGDQSGAYGCAAVGTSAALIVAANASRKGISIQSDHANTDYIYIGYDNTVSTSNWLAKLEPGQAWSRNNTTSAIYAVSGTAAQNIGYDEP